MPKTRLGKWSAGLIITFLLLFVIFQLLVASGQRGGETFSDNLTLSIPALLMAAAGIAAFLQAVLQLSNLKNVLF